MSAAAVMPAVVSITNKSVEGSAELLQQIRIRCSVLYRGEHKCRGSGIIIGQNDRQAFDLYEQPRSRKLNRTYRWFCRYGSAYEAVVKGTDAANDLAVVAVKLDDISDDTMDAIKIAEIGDSDDLVVGQQVVAIGNALGYGQSVTTGIVSALNRTIQIEGNEQTLIQTDAAINPGNSGGALLDMQGRVIGINSAKASANGVEGMGYAIPISTAKPILEDLMNKKTRTETVSEEDSAYIGITGQAVSNEMSFYSSDPQESVLQ